MATSDPKNSNLNSKFKAKAEEILALADIKINGKKFYPKKAITVFINSYAKKNNLIKK